MFENYKKKKTQGATFDDSDIFADFSGDKNLKKDVENFEKNEKRDVFDILNIFSTLLKVVNIVLVLVIFLGFSYVYIQKDPAFSEDSTLSSIINPVCSLFIGEKLATNSVSCPSVSYLVDDYNKKISELKKNQSDKIASIINSIYKSENFIDSKEVVFLRDNIDNRLKPSKVLEEFNKLKSDFTYRKDPKILSCNDISISSENILTTNCNTYVSGWNNLIVGYNGSDITQNFYGSSISLANSFLNYISKGNHNFYLMERQKSFISRELLGELYTETTEFNLKLKYLNSNLSL